MKKNFVTIVTALVLVLSLAGCSVTVNGPAAGQTQTTSGKDEAASSEQAAETAEADAPASEALQECEHVRDATLVEAEMHILMPRNVSENAIADYLRRRGFAVGEQRPIEPSLEDVFVTLTREIERQEAQKA